MNRSFRRLELGTKPRREKTFYPATCFQKSGIILTYADPYRIELKAWKYTGNSFPIAIFVKTNSQAYHSVSIEFDRSLIEVIKLGQWHYGCIICRTHTRLPSDVLKTHVSTY